ncbi:Ankyrin repeat-containing protein BDA1 [Bienertia sinuspersici]
METQIEINTNAATTTTMLYEAIIKGNVTSFTDLLREDPLIVDRCIIENSPEHFNQSPLHVAADMGNLEMVKALVSKRPSMCLARDQDGRHPIHVAAIKGHVNVVQALHEKNPHAAQDMTNGGETILHLCIKHKQLEALKKLVEITDKDGDHLINCKDNYGNTVLHLAVNSKQDENAINKSNMTAVDIHLKQSRNNSGNPRIEEILKDAKAKVLKDVLNHRADEKWLEKQCASLMVVASLIAAAAFQVGMNPPGGVWQDDKKEDTRKSGGKQFHEIAGFSVWSSRNTSASKDEIIQNEGYKMVMFCNTIALISSLSVILLLISNLPVKRLFLSILRVTLWITVTATTLTYLLAANTLTDSKAIETMDSLSEYSIVVWLGLMGIIVVVNGVRLILQLLGWYRRELIIRSFKQWFR